MARLCLFLLLLLQLALAPNAWAEEIKVKYRADRIQYLNEKKTFLLIGNVEMTVKDAVITSEEIEYDTDNKILLSRLPFEIVQTSEGQQRTLTGKTFNYNVNLKRIEATDAFLTLPAPTPGQEIFIHGDLLVAFDEGQRIIFHNGFFTTCDGFVKKELKEEGVGAALKHAIHYSISADIIDFIRDDRIYAWNVKIESYERQLFWYPFWVVPLKGSGFGYQPDVRLGQNPVEGVFASFRNYYQWNEFHDGYWFLSLMEKKGIGLGFQHDWIAAPNSITRFYFYGLPVTKEILGVPGALFSGPSTSEETGFLTQQVSFFDPISFWANNKFEDREFVIQHKQRLLPTMEADFTYQDRDFYNVSVVKADRNPQRSFDFRLQDNELFNLDPDNQLRIGTQLTFRQAVTSPKTVTRDPQLPLRTEITRFQETQSRSASITTGLGQGALDIRTDWNQNTSSSLTEFFENNAFARRDSQPAQGNENWNSSLNYRTPLTERTNLTSSVVHSSSLSGGGPGFPSRLTQTLTPTVRVDQNLDWGTLSGLYEDFFDLSPPAAGGQNFFSGRVRKIPELDLRLNPFFQETFPVQLETRLGRYFDPASVIPTENLNEIARSVFKINLPAKEVDLGLGTKVNFGGSNFEQRFYQTQDAEYILTAQVNLRNDFTKYFVPTFSYQRTVQDQENNNSPFVNFEPLQLRTINMLTGRLNLFNIPELTWSIDSGYDYLNRQYLPLRTDLTSQIGDNFILSFHTDYTFQNIREQDVGKELRDIDGNIYRHGDPVNGAPILVQPEDVGSLNLLGGRWGVSTLGLRWRSSDEPFATGHLTFFGLEEGIPEGLELGGNIAYDFHQGKIQAFNGLVRFSIGQSWPWHTELDLMFTVQPTNFPTKLEDLSKLDIPYKLVLRKDLHDFLLTLSWDSFYQQFNINLSLIAFPFSTSDVVSNVTSLSNQAQTLGGQAQTLGGQF